MLIPPSVARLVSMVVAPSPTARMFGSAMRPRPTMSLSRVASVGVWGLLCLLAAPLQAETDDATKPDQVLARNRRTGSVSPISGVVEENSLKRVVVRTTGDKKRDVDSELVVRVVYGNVPPAYREASMYFDRGEFTTAAAKYKLAAGDASGRAVVQASARLRAAEALMKSASLDVAAFEQAAAQAATFLADHPTNREVPVARSLQARASLLAGEPVEAADLYRLLFREAENDAPNEGYSWTLCMSSGLHAAEAFIEARDAEKARETYAALDSALTRILGTLPTDDAARAQLLSIQAASRLGEGWALLAGGGVSQARTFFRGQLSQAEDPGAPPELRFGTLLGLAESMLADGEPREASLRFAMVSALDHTSRDRAARALVGLAACAVKSSDADARTDAKRSLQIVIDHYGDTPAARRAQEMSQTL